MVRLIHKIVLATTIVFCCSATLFAQKESSDVRRGNKAYDKEKYVDAEVDYRKGLEQNNKSFSAAFNLGDALYRQEKYPEAAEQFQRAATLAGDDKGRLASSYHNLGNSLMQTGDYAKSVEAYKQALRNNPKDDETRYNLAYAQQMLKQQQEQQQNQQQNQDQNKQDQQQQQQNQQQEQQEQNQEQEQQQQQNQQQSDMSREQAEQILQALEQDERDTQEKVKEQQMQQTKRYRVDKDW